MPILGVAFRQAGLASVGGFAAASPPAHNWKPASMSRRPQSAAKPRTVPLNSNGRVCDLPPPPEDSDNCSVKF